MAEPQAAFVDVRKAVYAGIGGFLVVGTLNAISMYNQSQVFKDTTTGFIQTQTARNEKQDVTNAQLTISVAELKQQSQDQNRRLELIESKK